MILEFIKNKLFGVVREKTEEEPWARDESSFADHFGVEYEEFAEMVGQLDFAHREMYDATLKVNPEAAVTWVVFLVCEDS